MFQTPKWPHLRHELAVYDGPTARDGSPTWSINDPVRNLYFGIDWITFEVLSRWHFGNVESIVESINIETTLQVDEEVVQGVLGFLQANELLIQESKEDIKRLTEDHQRRKSSLWSWMVKNYLFFRVPLVRPNRWLEQHVDKVAPFFTKQFFYLTIAIFFVAIIQIIQQWDAFKSQLVDFFSLSGLMLYGVTLVVVKTLHELGHAFVAKKFGCRVPTMGVAFLVMFPMAYTDVNDVWRLTKSSQRLWVGAAGILTELTLAVWFSFLWAFLPEGGLRDISFLVATTTWISTLLVNASPFMRFDGYFLTMDALRLPNLHQRAFEQAKWRLRRVLFALPDERPEYFSAKFTHLLLLFAYGTWLYRLIVFSGIAVLVYYVFPKPLGPILAAIEIGVFILLPVWNEMKMWFSRKEEIKANRRVYKWLSFLILIGLIVVVPWDKRIETQAIYRPVKFQTISSPGPAQIKQLLIENGQVVNTGDILLKLSSEDLSFELQAEQAKQEGLKWQVGATGIDRELRDKLGVLLADRYRAESKVEGLQERINRFDLVADVDAKVMFIDPDLHIGQWVRDHEELLELYSTSNSEVVTYVNDKALARMRVGQSATFFASQGFTNAVELMVTRIDKDSTHALQDKMLASIYGGEILTRESAGAIVPEYATYRVVLSPSSSEKLPPTNHILGRVVIYAESEAWITAYLNSFIAVLRREMSF